jgi:hypothetical protein
MGLAEEGSASLPPGKKVSTCCGCIKAASALTLMLNRVEFGLTFYYRIQGASWPAQKLSKDLLPLISLR